MSEAQINMAVAEQIRSGHVGEFAGEHIGVIINLETSKNFYFYHPTRDGMIEVKPGSCKFIRSSCIPDRIFGRFDCQNSMKECKVYEKSSTYNGVEVDYGFQVKF